jgi:hypothetical protein
LFLRAKSTLAQSGEMLAILEDILLNTRLDNAGRFKQIVLEQKAGIETQLAMRGDIYAYKRMAAHFTRAGWASEQIGGISSLVYLRRLVEEIDRDWQTVLARLERMRHLLVTRHGLIINVTMPAEDWPEFSSALNTSLEKLPDDAPQPLEWDQVKPPLREGLVIPSQVNYVGKAGNLSSAGYKLDGSAEVIVNHLRMTYLWEKIRVQGGAYGAFCVFDNNAGILSFLSFRDPNVDATLDNYTRVADFLKGITPDRLSNDELLKSVIGVIGLLDAYQLPDAKGFTSMLCYLSGETDEIRQIYRDQVLTTAHEDFNEFGQMVDMAFNKAVVAVVGTEAALKTAKMDLSVTPVI